MITAVNSCGCAPKLTVPQDCPPPSPPCTPISTSNRSRPGRRRPFENPRPKPSKEDEARCRCPRHGEAKYESLGGQCSPRCEGVFPEEKVVSKIVQGGKPYKEIEAVINDNRMVIRIQRESSESEWDPPCDCSEGVGRLKGGGCEPPAISGCGKNVVFQKADDSCGSRVNCRTVTVFPQPEELPVEPKRENSENDNKKEKEKPVVPRLVDLEDNPNIFLLRIRKRSEKFDRKNYIDLEFRTPRPWTNKPKPKVVTEPQTPSEPVVEKKAANGKGKGKKKKGKK